MKNQNAATDGTKKLNINNLINFKVTPDIHGTKEGDVNYFTFYYGGFYQWLKSARDLHTPTQPLYLMGITVSNTN